MMLSSTSQQTRLPLEEVLYRLSLSPNCFPNATKNYFSTYMTLKQYVCDEYYRWTGAGTAGDRFLTDHGPKHINSVISYAGRLLGLSTHISELDVSNFPLSHYETYIFLVAILVHDAGNIYGREGHERRAFPILKGAGPAVIDAFEAKRISDIAEVHGGERNGSKDTISQMGWSDKEEVLGFSYRPKLLAAIMRFADEIAEDSLRTSSSLLREDGTILGGSEIFHQYASIVENVSYDKLGKRIKVEYKILKEQATKRFKKGSNDVYLIDFVIERLDKMNLERLYCARFMWEVVRVDSIRARVRICSDINHDLLREQTFEIEDEGYPILGESSLAKKHPDWNGVLLHTQLEGDTAYGKSL